MASPISKARIWTAPGSEGFDLCFEGPTIHRNLFVQTSKMPVLEAVKELGAFLSGRPAPPPSRRAFSVRSGDSVCCAGSINSSSITLEAPGVPPKTWIVTRPSYKEIDIVGDSTSWKIKSNAIAATNLVMTCFSDDRIVFELRGSYWNEWREWLSGGYLRMCFRGFEYIGRMEDAAECNEHMPALLYAMEFGSYGYPTSG